GRREGRRRHEHRPGQDLHLPVDRHTQIGAMSKLIRHLSGRLRDERGMALMLAIALTTILGAVSVTVVQVVQHEQSRSTQAVKRDASFQAAEAGIDEYIAKLLDDGSYDVHNVHPAESTRRSTSGVNVAPSCTGTPSVCT